MNHDLRNALGVVAIGLATLALKSRPIDEQPALDGARQGLSWARGLIDALDELAQIDDGAVPVRAESVALDQLAATILRTFESTAAEKGLTLGSTAPALSVMVDRRLLNRVLQNLVDNAIKYTVRGAISVSAHHAAGQLVWTVEDTGPGIPEPEHERVFDEFYQLDNPERSREKGRGLELSVVRRFVALMAGTVVVNHGTAGGARFIVTIPCEAVSPNAQAIPTTDEMTRADHRATVWIIEDQFDSRDGLTQLVRALGYDVRAFDEPEPAIFDLAKTCPDALLCDLRLRAGTNALDVVRALREQVASLPVAIVTGEAASERIQQLNSAGFTVMRKPLDAQALSEWLAVGSNPALLSADDDLAPYRQALKVTTLALLPRFAEALDHDACRASGTDRSRIRALCNRRRVPESGHNTNSDSCESESNDRRIPVPTMLRSVNGDHGKRSA